MELEFKGVINMTKKRIIIIVKDLSKQPPKNVMIDIPTLEEVLTEEKYKYYREDIFTKERYEYYKGYIPKIFECEEEVGSIYLESIMHTFSIPIVKKEHSVDDKLILLARKMPEYAFIVPSFVLDILKGKGVKLNNVFAPDTGPNSAIKDEDGNIIGVKRLVTL